MQARKLLDRRVLREPQAPSVAFPQRIQQANLRLNVRISWSNAATPGFHFCRCRAAAVTVPFLHLGGHNVAVLDVVHQLLAAPQARVVDVAAELHPPDAGLQRV
jgi:hypothetical protein